MSLDQLIPASIGLLIFGLPTGYLSWLWLLGLQSRSWSTTTGTITHAMVKPGQRNQASVSVGYRYEVNGTTYTGSTVRFGDFLNATVGDARETAGRYRQGAPVTVYYHPRRPKIATLETRASRLIPMWVVLGGLMLSSIIYGLLTAT